MADSTSLIERLRQWARQQAEASKMLADAKTARQTDGGYYSGGEPEQMIGWEAADALEALSAALEPFDDALGEDDDGYPDDTLLTMKWMAHTAYLTLGELRKLRAALNTPEKPE